VKYFEVICRGNSAKFQDVSSKLNIIKISYSSSKVLLLGQVAGYRRHGKPLMRWLDSIKEATGLWLGALKETVQDKKNGKCWWRKRLRIGNAQM